MVYWCPNIMLDMCFSLICWGDQELLTSFVIKAYYSQLSYVYTLPGCMHQTTSIICIVRGQDDIRIFTYSTLYCLISVFSKIWWAPLYVGQPGMHSPNKQNWAPAWGLPVSCSLKNHYLTGLRGPGSWIYFRERVAWSHYGPLVWCLNSLAAAFKVFWRTFLCWNQKTSSRIEQQFIAHGYRLRHNI